MRLTTVLPEPTSPCTSLFIGWGKAELEHEQFVKGDTFSCGFGPLARLIGLTWQMNLFHRLRQSHHPVSGEDSGRYPAECKTSVFFSRSGDDTPYGLLMEVFDL